MQIGRRMAVSLLGSILALSLLGLVWTHVANATLRNQTTVKGWLNQSGIYDKLVTSVLDENSETPEESANVPLDDPRVREIANEAFNPAYVQQNVERVVDGVYGWLDGTTAEPSFSVDLNDAKQRLADGLGKYATERAASLPPCSAAESRQLAAEGSANVLSATCLPIGVTPEQAGAQLRDEVLANDTLVNNPVLNGGIKVERDGQSLSLTDVPELKAVKSAYQFGAWLPYVFIGAVLASFAGVVFLSSTKRKGLTIAGIIVLVCGVIVGVNWFVLDRSVSWLNDRTNSLAGNSGLAQEITGNLLGSVRNDTGNILLWYTVSYLIIGAGCIILAKYFKRTLTFGHKEVAAAGPAPDTASEKADESTLDSPESKDLKNK